MKLSVYSIQNTLFAGEVEKIVVQTPLGEITVLDGHIPLISSLCGPSIHILDQKNQINTIKIMSGFLEVRPENQAVILANS